MVLRGNFYTGPSKFYPGQARVGPGVATPLYTSQMAVTEFIEALGTWVEESLFKDLHQAPFYSIMADKCTDISTLEELSLFCRWIENGERTEHFIDLLPMKRTDAEAFTLHWLNV